MSDCEFGCDLVCVYCGYQARRAGTRRNCTVERPPSVTAQLSSYAAAVSRWLAAGRPVRTDEQVAGLLAICQDNRCGKYRDGQCLACGCRVNSSGWALANKLRMATESCPKGMWTGSDRIGTGSEPDRNRTATGPDRIRVGILTPNLYVGGVETWLLSLAKEWRRSGAVDLIGIGHIGTEGTHQPTFTRQLTPACPVVSSCQIDGAHVVRSPLDAAGTVASAADVLIVWSCPADILARVKRPGQIVVGVSHGCHDWWMGAAAPLVDRWTAVHAAAVRPIPADPATVEILPNGVDLERCRSSLTRPEARQWLGIDGDGPIVGYVGRLSPEKRIREIVASVEHLPDEWRLLVVGDGREREAVVGPRVIHRPATDRIGDVWRAVDVAVVASDAEGYCLSAVEAIAAGVPLAATAVGVVPEIPGVQVIPQPARPVWIAEAIEQAAGLGLSDDARRWAADQSAERMAARWAGWLASVRSAS